MIENRDVPHQWTSGKPDFRKSFGDSMSTTTFAQDIYASNLAIFGGDFNKFYSHVAKILELHIEPFLSEQIDLGETMVS